MNFENRHIFISGGTGALGHAVVAAFTQAGATCHVAVRDQDTPPPGVVPVAVNDLANEADVARAYAAIPDLWASIHLAGGFTAGPLVDTDKATMMAQWEINFATSFLCCRAAVRAMQASGAGGRIVNVAARAALEWRAGAGMSAYAASKAALAAFTVALSAEVIGDNILVNAVAPGTMDTPANRRAMPKTDPAGWAKVEDVAQTILFLASPENKVTSGAVVPVYGKS
jgi:NAD(P)-dependent dehydrogenase (short-subunit alcohol dehydrogenase family)